MTINMKSFANCSVMLVIHTVHIQNSLLLYHSIFHLKLHLDTFRLRIQTRPFVCIYCIFLLLSLSHSQCYVFSSLIERVWADCACRNMAAAHCVIHRKVSMCHHSKNCVILQWHEFFQLRIERIDFFEMLLTELLFLLLSDSFCKIFNISVLWSIKIVSMVTKVIQLIEMLPPFQFDGTKCTVFMPAPIIFVQKKQIFI